MYNQMESSGLSPNRTRHATQRPAAAGTRHVHPNGLVSDVDFGVYTAPSARLEADESRSSVHRSLALAPYTGLTDVTGPVRGYQSRVVSPPRGDRQPESHAQRSGLDSDRPLNASYAVQTSGAQWEGAHARPNPGDAYYGAKHHAAISNRPTAVAAAPGIAPAATVVHHHYYGCNVSVSASPERARNDSRGPSGYVGDHTDGARQQPSWGHDADDYSYSYARAQPHEYCSPAHEHSGKGLVVTDRDGYSFAPRPAQDLAIYASDDAYAAHRTVRARDEHLPGHIVAARAETHLQVMRSLDVMRDELHGAQLRAALWHVTEDEAAARAALLQAEQENYEQLRGAAQLLREETMRQWQARLDLQRRQRMADDERRERLAEIQMGADAEAMLRRFYDQLFRGEAHREDVIQDIALDQSILSSTAASSPRCRRHRHREMIRRSSERRTPSPMSAIRGSPNMPSILREGRPLSPVRTGEAEHFVRQLSQLQQAESERRLERSLGAVGRTRSDVSSGAVTPVPSVGGGGYQTNTPAREYPVVSKLNIPPQLQANTSYAQPLTSRSAYDGFAASTTSIATLTGTRSKHLLSGGGTPSTSIASQQRVRQPLSPTSLAMARPQSPVQQPTPPPRDLLDYRAGATPQHRRHTLEPGSSASRIPSQLPEMKRSMNASIAQMSSPAQQPVSPQTQAQSLPHTQSVAGLNRSTASAQSTYGIPWAVSMPGSPRLSPATSSTNLLAMQQQQQPSMKRSVTFLERQHAAPHGQHGPPAGAAPQGLSPHAVNSRRRLKAMSLADVLASPPQPRN